jgi:hypothetical protein
MSDAITRSVPHAETAPTPKLQLVGDTDADACVGEFCELPVHREHAVMNRRVDSDLI